MAKAISNPVERASFAASVGRYSADVLLGPTKEMVQLSGIYSEAERARTGPEGLVDLTQSVPRFAAFDEAVARGTEEYLRFGGKHDYSNAYGEGRLREMVARILAEERGVRVDPEKEILVSSGASQAIQWALQAFIDPGDGIAVFDPAYMFFLYSARLRGARVRWIPSSARDGRIEFDRKALRSALSACKLLYLNYPSNPSGCVFSRDDLEFIAEAAREADVVVVCDEVYAAYAAPGSCPSILEIPAAKEHCVVINSFSKSCGMANLRVGYAIGHESLLRGMQMTAVCSALPVPSLNQFIALHAWEICAHERAAKRASFADRGKSLGALCKELELSCAPATLGFHRWVDISGTGLDAFAFTMDLLRKERVLVSPGNHFGPSGARRVRLSFAGEETQFRRGLERFSRYFARRQGAGR